LVFVVGVWWVLAVRCGKGLALHSGYNPPHLVWPNCGWLWHHNLTTKPATFLVGLWCKCGAGYHNVPRVGPHLRHTSDTHRPHTVVEVWRDRINRGTGDPPALRVAPGLHTRLTHTPRRENHLTTVVGPQLGLVFYHNGTRKAPLDDATMLGQHRKVHLPAS